MQLRDERYLALLRATERKYALPKAEEERRELEEIRNLRLALEDEEYKFRFGPFRRLAPWAQLMRNTRHLLQKLDSNQRRLYNRYNHIGFCLLGLGGQLMKQGELSVWKGHDGEWPTVQRGVEYRFWSLRVWDSAHEIVPWNWTAPQTWAAVAVTTALATRRWTMARLASDFLLRMITGYPRKEDWQYSPFTAFVIKLCQIWDGTIKQEAAPTAESLGGYRGVVEQWAEGRLALGKAIWDACDFHCITLRPRPNEESDYYHAGDAAAFPCEILAIYRIREQLGLDTPKISRPLLDSPLANPPMNIPRIEDPLLDEVARKFCAEFSQEEGPWRS